MRISWEVMLDHADHAPNDIIAWVESAPGGSWHLSGWDEWTRLESHGRDYKGIDGFEFRFERREDAVMFALRWGAHDTP